MYLAFITDCIYDIKRIRVDKETKFEEIGLDSIEFVQLIINIEDKFNIEFDDEELKLDIYNNLDDLVKIIERHV